MRAVVTGAGGFLGSKLCIELINTGYEVVGVSRSPLHSCLKKQGIIEVVCASDEYEYLATKVGSECDYFFHFAWEGVSGLKAKDMAVQQANIDRAIMALRSAHALQVKRFIGAGSIHELECIKDKESGDERARHVPDYKIAKLMAHYFCEAEA